MGVFFARQDESAILPADGPEACIIDCQSNGRGFYFHNNEKKTSVISGFKIINGYISQPDRDMSMAEGDHAAVAAGVDADGGGILVKDCSPTIEDCVISYCTVEGSGGGIAVWGDPENSSSSPIIRDCDIFENSALESEDESGGRDIVLNTDSSAVIVNCIIYNDRAGSVE